MEPAEPAKKLADMPADVVQYILARIQLAHHIGRAATLGAAPGGLPVCYDWGAPERPCRRTLVPVVCPTCCDVGDPSGTSPRAWPCRSLVLRFRSPSGAVLAIPSCRFPCGMWPSQLLGFSLALASVLGAGPDLCSGPCPGRIFICMREPNVSSIVLYITIKAV